MCSMEAPPHPMTPAVGLFHAYRAAVVEESWVGGHGLGVTSACVVQGMHLSS
jgi:hypothetical protein